MKQKHDFKAALELLYALQEHEAYSDECLAIIDRLMGDMNPTLETALSVADRLQIGKVSDCMDLAAFKCETQLSENTAYQDIFKAMAAQMIKECENDAETE